MRAQGGGNGETHFSVQVVSEIFEGKVRSPFEFERSSISIELIFVVYFVGCTASRERSRDIDW